MQPKGAGYLLMRSMGKSLLGVAVFSLLLAGVSMAIVFIREKPQYWPDGTPLATAHNYLLAFKQDDLTRAYGYLSPNLDGYPPSVEEFIEQISNCSRGDHLSFALTLELVDSGQAETVVVRARERRFFGSPLELIFGSPKGTFEGVYHDRENIPEDVLEEMLNRDWTANSKPFVYYPTKFIPDGHFIRSFDMQLQQENGVWKIVGSQTYWLRCWDVANGCE